EHYRMRAEFRMWHKGDTVSYVMFTPDEYRRIYDVTHFPVGSALINELMPRLLAELNSSDILRKKLYQVDFLTTLSGESLITLIYHKPLSSEWETAAQHIKDTLNTHIVGRSRKQKCVIGKDYVLEELQVKNKTFT